MPQYPQMPKKCQGECATIKLMRANKREGTENRISGDGLLVFNNKLAVYIPKKWENFKMGFWAGSAYYYFNDHAEFQVPAGTYDLDFMVKLLLVRKPMTATRRNVILEPGANYELWLYFDNTSRRTGSNTYNVTRYIQILQIKKVRFFQNNKTMIGPEVDYYLRRR